MVTHDPELAKKHADIVYWLKDGKLEKTTKKRNGVHVPMNEYKKKR